MSTFNSSGPEDKSVVIRAVLDGKADFGARARAGGLRVESLQ